MNAPAEPRLPPAYEEGRALLSALADGEADAEAGCALWRDDADARASWHAYQLIGDVLRSEDLAMRPARDAAFLAALRVKLADEPVVLAPLARPRPLWLRRAALPAAVAAGFVAVFGVLVVARAPAPGAAEGPQLAVGPRPDPSIRLAGNGTPPAPLVITGTVIRDAQLDAYLRAHREALGGAAAAMPGAMPRSIETLAPAGTAAAQAVR